MSDRALQPDPTDASADSALARTDKPLTVAQLEVTHGRHQGVSIPLESAVCQIGADAHSDVVLSDDGINARHAIVRIHGRRLAVEACGGDVSVDGRVLPQGTGCRAQFPVTIMLGEARLRLERPSTRSLFTLPRRAPLAAAANNVDSRASRLGLMGLMTLTLAVTIFYQIFDVKAGADIFQQSATDTAAADVAKAPTADDIVDALDQRLALAGLQDLDVQGEDNRILVSGRVAPSQKAQWTGVQQWFDSHYGADHVLTSAVETGNPARPDVDFQAVWLGDNPYVIGGDGKRRYQGATIDDGWVLEDITPEHILLSRGDDQFSLTL